MNDDGLGITIYHTLAEENPSLREVYVALCVCGHAYHRQRNTLSTKRHRCGLCRGPLQELLPVILAGNPHPQPSPGGEEH